MEGDELLGIGQFARHSGLAVSALRFYADTGVLTPAEVDAASGYRRYLSTQIPIAVQIRQLRQLDMPLAEIRRLLALSANSRARELRGWRDRFAQQTSSTIAVVDGLITDMNGEDPMTTTVTARDWYEALRQVVPAAGPGDRPTLASVFVERRPDALRLVATDSLRLCVRDIVPVAGDEATDESVAVLASGLWPFSIRTGDPDRTNPDRTVDIDISNSGLVVRDGDNETTVPRTEGDYPDYERLLEAMPASAPAVAQRTELAAALVSFGPAAAVAVTVATSGINLALPDDSELVVVPCDYTSDPVRFGVQPRFMVDALQAMSGPDVAVDASGGTSPITLRSASDGSVMTMVMPIVLKAPA